jgi:hypothetical protein
MFKKNNVLFGALCCLQLKLTDMGVRWHFDRGGECVCSWFGPGRFPANMPEFRGKSQFFDSPYPQLLVVSIRRIYKRNDEKEGCRSL